MSFLDRLRERRVFRILAAYGAGGWLLLQAADQLVSRQLLPEFAYQIALVFFLAGVPATAVVAWYHGQKGDQPIPPREVWMLAAVGVVALTVSGMIVAGETDGSPASGVRAEVTSPEEQLRARLQERRLAVLYFDDLSPDGELRHLADGLTDALIHELTGLQGLEVVSRNGVERYRDSDAPLDSIALDFRAGMLVQGSVARSGDQLRVAVQLLDPVTGTQIESETIRRPQGELFALQDEVADRVARFLRRRLGEEFRLRERRAGTESVEAWETVQRAEELVRGVAPLLDAGDLEAADRQFERADSLLARAGRLDPDWAEPLVLRGELDYRRSRWPETGDRRGSAHWVDEALAHSDGALELAPDDPDALELRGTARYWKWLLNLAPDPEEAEALFEGAETDLRAAIARDSAQAGAWAVLSHLLLVKEETAQAKIAARRAYQADAYLRNVESVIWRLFTTSYDLEDPVEAEHWCDEGNGRFAENPRFTECRLWLLTMESNEPDVALAWELSETYVELSPPPQADYRESWASMAVAAVLARAELPDSARAVIERAELSAEEDPTRDLLYLEAFVRSLLGERDTAVDRLSTYLATNPQRQSDVDSWWFSSLRGMPAFEELRGSAPGS